jgi:hypothetical protein
MITNRRRRQPSRKTNNTYKKFSSTLSTQKKLHNDSYKQMLGFLNDRLDPRMAFLNRCLHHTASDTITNLLMQTAGRYSGVLGGGITAGIGSIAVWLAASHYGFYYSSLSFVALYAVGFIIGLAAELFIKLISSYR